MNCLTVLHLHYHARNGHESALSLCYDSSSFCLDSSSTRLLHKHKDAAFTRRSSLPVNEDRRTSVLDSWQSWPCSSSHFLFDSLLHLNLCLFTVLDSFLFYASIWPWLCLINPFYASHASLTGASFVELITSLTACAKDLQLHTTC